MNELNQRSVLQDDTQNCVLHVLLPLLGRSDPHTLLLI